MTKIGNRARLTIQRPPRDLVDKFRDARPPDLADAMNKSGAMRAIVPMYAPMAKCVGTAVTVRTQPGDSLLVQKAVDIAEPGDVIVVDGRGVISRSVWGGVRSTFAVHRGVVGVVVDGATRDVDDTKSLGLPLFARAVAPIGSGFHGPGELNYPIACGGVVVNPGDIVVADEQGIVVIPWQEAEDVYVAWRKIMEREEIAHKLSTAGRPRLAEEMERMLTEIGCELTP